ncbi:MULTISPECIES: type II toxin-antitoxin system RnlB family antitoxin [Proteus]|uniref:type II toxin-antitoxin system RnlB family antitoxin n=1 Tax=Proteus TaxID=583 RepID=UPI0013900FD0|nr:MULTISPECIES: type II toxin-antitoxin system RnlB family antitoxin [Proteus]MCI9729341.1 type II toxin-antitoxin system RnlB family antitoxin [Proteus mirabilis]MCI9733096.1 type II toxin-antitoxin system RnlB family antitoxin [Proteus mirabilis]MCI9736853.1 type II toxin-antitoxin system RnlB family antitoxin [Proteus mirabilis]MCI9757643.1 type II toxin-antitoxin system RnlB family antitoxin [Proteus mirabilis]MCI9761401.1 type II toxin-antitoxin system RnlB family antitoxin [Proteus mira
MTFEIKQNANMLVVCSTSYENPLHELTTIAQELVLLNFCGDVIFDLLCVNGISRNRFISIKFDPLKGFDRKSKKAFKSHSLENEQNHFYSTKRNYLYNSVLAKETVDAFLHAST